MDLFKPGTDVTIRANEPIQGVVLQICIAGEALRVTYQVGWWDHRTHRSEWFDSGLISSRSEEKLSIGFQNGPSEETD